MSDTAAQVPNPTNRMADHRQEFRNEKNLSLPQHRREPTPQDIATAEAIIAGLDGESREMPKDLRLRWEWDD